MPDDVTLGEALIAAKKAMDDADAAFRQTLREASLRGASTRDMAKLLNMSHSTLWRWMEGGSRRRRSDVLSRSSAPAEVVRDD